MLITCPFCGGSGAEGNTSQPCVYCNGQGQVVDVPARTKPFVTERFRVTGQATDRVIVIWPNGVEHTLYRTDPEGS